MAKVPERHRERYECERERKICGQINPRRKKQIPEANQRRQPGEGTRARIAAVTADVRSGLAKTAGFWLMSKKEAESGRV